MLAARIPTNFPYPLAPLRNLSKSDTSVGEEGPIKLKTLNPKPYVDQRNALTLKPSALNSKPKP